MKANWQELLIQAATQPGLILRAYTNFHNYSLGNQLLAYAQCLMRNLPPGPLNTYPGWQRLGRQARRGEKALTLCMPLTWKKQSEDDEETISATFVYKPRWFVLAQTEGDPVPMPEMPTWDRARALARLNVTEEPFTATTNGNVMGYARNRGLAISPLNPLPYKTLFHELAHIVLGHVGEMSFTDDERTPTNLREVEAEAVALLLCESLELEGAAYCRGYIQGWLRSETIPEQSAQKIFGAADRILRAGREPEKERNQEQVD
jgi:antirestriction protein ArdC